jgi:hypothetical protein
MRHTNVCTRPSASSAAAPPANEPHASGRGGSCPPRPWLVTRFQAALAEVVAEQPPHARVDDAARAGTAVHSAPPAASDRCATRRVARPRRRATGSPAARAPGRNSPPPTPDPGSAKSASRARARPAASDSPSRYASPIERRERDVEAATDQSAAVRRDSMRGPSEACTSGSSTRESARGVKRPSGSGVTANAHPAAGHNSPLNLARPAGQRSLRSPPFDEERWLSGR